MSVDLSFQKNQLLLNPRLPDAQKLKFEEAWNRLVEPNYHGHVGIATSGSSGASQGKLILLSKGALHTSAKAVNERFQSGPHDVWFKSLPNFHVGGLGILVRAHLSGAKVYEDKSEKWEAASFVAQVAESRSTLISLVPTQVFDLVQAKLKAPPSVRAVIVGGGRFENTLRQKAAALGWPCLASYGMTETSSQIATAMSVNNPKLVLLAHAQAKQTESGRLAIKSGALLTAQIVFDEAGSRLFDPKLGDWFVSEDRGHVENSYTLIVEGRASDFVKIGGEGVLISKLEDVFDHLKLSVGYEGDAALLAAEDERLGAIIVVVATTDVKTDELVSRFNASVMPYERIRKTEIVPRIPRSVLGKLLRSAALELVGLKSLAHE